MKNLIRTSLVAIVLFCATQLDAGDTPTLRNLKDGKTTVLTLSDVNKGNQLFVKDLFGQILYNTTIQISGEFEKGFNLTFLQNGEYYFELKKESEIRRIPFLVQNHKIEPLVNKEFDINHQFSKIGQNHSFIKEIQFKKKPHALEKGVQRDIPSFKGQDFVNYYKLNNRN